MLTASDFSQHFDSQVVAPFREDKIWELAQNISYQLKTK